MTIAQPSIERRVVLDDVSWGFYQHMLDEVGDGHIRLTYDGGRLEIMSPSNLHELMKKLLARIIEAYADAKGIDIEGLGSTTFRRADLRKGLEPDECYYVALRAEILGVEELDLTIHPPPDLVIEIDISAPEVARQPIYAALGVPELWRYDGHALQFLELQPERGYVRTTRSRAFPDLPLDRLNQFIETALKQGQSAAIAALRQWVKS